MFRFHTLVLLSAVSGLAATANADRFEGFGGHNTNAAVDRIDFGSNAVSLSAGEHQFRVFDYGSDASAGAFYGRDKNTAADTSAVTHDKFISQGWMPYSDSSFIDFAFDSPVEAFGFTTIDLLESYVAPDAYLALIAYDAEGEIIGKHLRTGPQGYSGLALGWEVGNLGRLIARARLVGEMWAGVAGGFDDFFIEEVQTVDDNGAPIVPLPTTAGLALAPLAGLGLRRRRA